MSGDKYAYVEIVPIDGNYQSDPQTWTVGFGGDRMPGWFADDQPAQEQRAKDAAARYMEAVVPGVAAGSMVSTSGYREPASTSGHRAPASTSGDYAPASTSGFGAPASTSGDCAPASTSGFGAPASTSGPWGASVCTGANAICMAEKPNCLIAALEYDEEYKPIGWVYGLTGKDGLEPNRFYAAKGGVLIAVPETDERVMQARAHLAEVIATKKAREKADAAK
jgi:hypothetical protein